MMEVRKNVNGACRLCLHGEGRISIFEENPKCSISPESIYDCVSVKITKEDRLPKGICENCLSNVKSWCIFKDTCDKTQETLNDWLNCNGIGGDDKEVDVGTSKNLLSASAKPFEISNGSEKSVLSVSALPDVVESGICPDENKKIGKTLSDTSRHFSEDRTGEISSTFLTEEENKQSSIVSSTKEIENVESHNVPKGFLATTESVMALCNELQESIHNKGVSNSIEPMEVTSNDIDDALPKISLPTSSDNLSSNEINDCFSAINSSVDAVEAILENSSQLEEVNEIKSIACNPDSMDTVELASSQSEEKSVSESDASKCLNVKLKDTADLLEVSPSEKVSCATSEATDSAANNPSEDSGIKSSENKVIPDTTTEPTPKENEVPKNAPSPDSDKENSTPNSSAIPANDISKEKLKVPESLETLTEGENQSLSGLRIESISTLTPETSELLYSQDGKTSSENNTSAKPLEKVGESISSKSSNSAVVGSSSGNSEESVPVEGQSSESEVISEQLSNSSSVQDNITDEDRSEINVNDHLEVEMNSRADAEQEIVFSQMMVQNIKQEPIDTHETPSGNTDPMFPIRVKSEFSSYDYDDNSGDLGNPSSTLGQETNKCDVCNRKYSSLSNYLKHLQTKVHLYNASLGPTENMALPNNSAQPDFVDPPINYADSYSEDSRLSGYSNDSPMLRSRLCPEDFMQAPTNRYQQPMIRQAQPRLPYPPAVSKLSRRKDKCRLCNTKFSYISEMRRHLLSKKHKSNVRLMSDNDVMMRENERMKRVCQQMLREKDRNRVERSVTYPKKEETPPLQSEKNQSTFICPIEHCHYSCQKGVRLLAHMRTHGIGQPPAPPAPLIKEFDNAGTKPKLSLRQQELLKKELEKRKSNAFSEQIVVEPLIRDYKCEGCSKTFLRESGLKKHSYYCSAAIPNEQEEEDEEEEDDEEEDQPKLSDNIPDSFQLKKMHCPICNLTFAAKSVFISHVQIYHKGSALENGLFRPPKPKKAVIAANKLRVKSRKGHGYVCNHCGKKFNLLSSLNFHLKVHSTKHICKICKKGYDSRRAFMDHCRLHFLPPGSKQTLCHKCFRVFKTRGEFSHHRKHDMCSIKMKIYTCNICQHSFKDPTALEEHKIRFHNDVLDVSDDEQTSSLDRRPLLQNLPISRQSFDSGNENRPGTSSKFHSSNINQSSNSAKSDPFLHCDVCDRDYATLASLKKHMWKYHQTKPLLTRQIDMAKKTKVLKANAVKCWKCKHCRRVFGNRRMLVVHLKKCKYNAFELEDGMCLQCGKWCESGKSRICRFCLPDLTKVPKPKKSLPEPNFLMTPKSEFMMNPKQEVNSAPARILNPGFPGPLPKTKVPLAARGIRLMKCPVGNKYFRSELLMIKHYSQCDGSCENRCSHCRKLFNSAKEYRVHLLNSNCYGHSRARPKGTKLSMKQLNRFNISNYLELEQIPPKREEGEVSAEVSMIDNSITDENSMMGLDSSMLNEPANKIDEEKSIKIGRVCTICNKVITMQRGLYRHVYGCFKISMLSQESVSCKKCNRTFSKHLSMKENTASIRQHILDCYYIPYYEGEGLLDDGSPSNIPPPLLCYVCSFGFSNNDNLRRHIMEHRSRKDEVNNIVLLLETELFSEKILNSETLRYNIQIQPESCETLSSQPVRKNNLLRFKVPGMSNLEPRKVIRKKLLECEKCSRKFTNRNKFLRHKKVHGIVTQSVFHEVAENYLEFITDHTQQPPPESTPPPDPMPPPPPSN